MNDMAMIIAAILIEVAAIEIRMIKREKLFFSERIMRATILNGRFNAFFC